MVVSTVPLAEAYQGFCKDIRIVPNYLSRAIWGELKSNRRNTEKPRIGWAGGAFHYGDLMVIKDVIKALADEVDWVFMGMCPDEIRPYIAEYHEGVDIDEYPAKLATLDLDLAVAPLEINAFNNAKSNLRILEYGILGWPVIATDIYPYQGAPVTLVKNRYKAWLKTIRDKLSDRQALIREGEELRNWVLENWILEDHLEEILKAYT
jgi:glycosyltransferase involved in cell wall biosynthesis